MKYEKQKPSEILVQKSGVVYILQWPLKWVS